MGKPNAIEQARMAVLRAQQAVVRCRAAVERFRAVSADRRADCERLRAGTRESIERSEAVMALSTARREVPGERTGGLLSAVAGPVSRD
ncbi:hypothetical protein JL100_019780 [Skermanella mucosa]|uniref:hypothetical protein n=1 Tax=Skermanella mucosa TaxID=1789672 RepID=UPI00192CA911|nr:hypothetical protein [Skermanella mucosa]UEM19321.1 hypothetical protein JL100_019780 [Skermanella mucosa]